MSAQTIGEPGVGRRVPLRGLVMIVWLVVYLLLMWHSGWPWESSSIWSFGSPSAVTLERAGAMVPAHASWERFFLSPWLHRSLLGAVLYLFFWSGVGGQVIAFAGVARAWILFVVGGAAGAAAHWLSYPDSGMAAGAGPFDAIAAMVGASLCWGFVSRAPGAKRVRNGSIVTLLIVAAFTWYATQDAGGNPEVWKLLGLEAMLAGFGSGVVLMGLFGPRRVGAPAGAGVRNIAFVLTLGVLAAGIAQGAALLGSADRQAAGGLIGKLESAEQAAWTLSRDQVEATDGQRAALSRLLERVLADPYLEGFAGLDVLRTYVDALRLYTQPVRLPWEAEGACRSAFEAWYAQHEKALRATKGLPERMAIRFYWRKP